MITRYVREIEISLENRCYFVALALTLTLPDICGAAEYPAETSVGKRYINWYNKYIGDAEQKERSSDTDSYLSGEVVYNLRNTFLHQGNPTINKDKIKAPENHFDKFILILGDGTKIREIKTQFDIANGAATFRAMSIDITYLCREICAAALLFDSQPPHQILDDILVIPQEYLIQPGTPESSKPDYSSFTQHMNQQLHQNGINVSIPESYFSGNCSVLLRIPQS